MTFIKPHVAEEEARVEAEVDERKVKKRARATLLDFLFSSRCFIRAIKREDNGRVLFGG